MQQKMLNHLYNSINIKKTVLSTYIYKFDRDFEYVFRFVMFFLLRFQRFHHRKSLLVLVIATSVSRTIPQRFGILSTF